MRILKITHITISLLYLTILQGQQTIFIQPSFNNVDIIPSEVYYSNELNDSIRFDVFKFYISDLELYWDNDLIYTNTNSHILVDLEKRETLSIPITSNDDKAFRFNRVKFKLGVDSLTNVSGAMGGDLDPMHGMYWTWQSGYINVKLEGRCQTINSRNNAFTYHLGGYQSPNYALQNVDLRFESAHSASMNFDMNKVISSINIVHDHHIMSPSAKAVEISKIMASSFTVTKER